MHGNERGDFDGREQTIPGRTVLEKDDMPGLLATEHVAAAQHFFENIAITDGGARQRDVFLREDPLQPEVGHGSSHDTVALKLILRFQKACGRQQNSIAIHHFPAFTDKERAVGIAIKSHAQTGLFRDDALLQTLQVKRATARIDVAAVG